MTNLLTTEDITVLGGPTSISIDMDFGPTGQRGNKIFVHDGNPNLSTVDNDLLYGDLCINSNSSSLDYRSIYIYQNKAGTKTWTKITNLIPNFYSRKSVDSFVDGNLIINIPLISISPSELLGSLTTDNFVIQHSIVNTVNPTTSNLSILDILDVNGQETLKLSVKAVELVNGAWVNVNGQRSVHLFISVV